MSEDRSVNEVLFMSQRESVMYLNGKKRGLRELLMTLKQACKTKGRLTDEHWWSYEEIENYVREILR